MRSKDVMSVLSSAITARLPLLLVGAPGVGKSDMVAQAASDASNDLLISHPVVADPTDAKGLPWPDAKSGSARFLPFGDLAAAIAAKQPTVWLLDDLGQAPAAVQASYMQLILARRINDHKIPEHITFIACTNRRQDRAGVQGILEPVKSRFACIIHVDPHVDDWSAWAISSGFVPPEMIAFLRNRPALLHDPQPSADITNSPSPRTWANAARLQSLGLPAGLQFAAFSGAVGEGAATEYMAFLAMFKNLVSVDQILLDPAGSPLPEKPGECYGVCTALAFRSNTQTFPRIATYSQRLYDAGKGEFATLTVRDCVRRDSAISSTSAFQKLLTGPLGQMIMGEVQ